jgi:RNA recognition motif-containing protein
MKNKLYVGNLSWNSTEADLSDTFSAFGEVVEAKIITDRETGRSRGFAFVTMSDEASANQAAAELDGTSIDGRNVRVNIAEDKRRDGGGGGGGGGGRGGRGGGGGGGGRQSRW